jgi:hypothetical protein
MKAGATIAVLAQPSSIREREELEAQRRQKQQAKAGSAVQEIVSAESLRDQKIREERAKAAAALEGIVQTQEERDQKAKEQKLQAAQTLELIAQGSPESKSRDAQPEVQRAKAGTAVQEIVDARIQQELKDKNQKIQASKTLGEIAQGEALFASQQKEQKQERRSSFSLLRRRTRKASDSTVQSQRHSVAIVPLPEIEPTTPMEPIEPSSETSNAVTPVEKSSTPISTQQPSEPAPVPYEDRPEKRKVWQRLRHSRQSQSPHTTDSKSVELEHEPKRAIVAEPVTEPISEPIVESVQEPVNEPVKEPIKEPVKESVTKPVKEPVKEVSKAPSKQLKEQKPSRLKAAFDRLKRRSGGAVLTHKDEAAPKTDKKREDGDSTELEDSSDDGSFHSTENPIVTPAAEKAPTEANSLYDMTPLPSAIPEHSVASSTYSNIDTEPKYAAATTTAEPIGTSQTPAITVIGVTEADGLVPVAKPVQVPGYESDEDDRGSVGRSDRLSGMHLETKFKEQL